MILLSFYYAVWWLIGPVIHIFLLYRCWRGKENPRRLKERWGIGLRPRPHGQVIWVHAASVGETQMVLPIIRSLLEHHPKLHIVLTTGTTTSAQVVHKAGIDRIGHQVTPLDHPWVINTFLHHWRPALTLWVESELWPHMLLQQQRLGIPIILTNGGISQKSARLWGRFPGAISRLLRCFTTAAVRSEAQKQRLLSLGLQGITIVGNLKFAAPALPVDAIALTQFQQTVHGRPLWIAASTHQGEESYIIAAHQKICEQFPSALCIIVPRHPERGHDVAGMSTMIGPSAQRSENHLITATTQYYIADTIGEMGLWYRLAPVAFIGASFISHGGHNPIEPIQLGCVPLYGPHMQNFSEVTEALAEPFLSCSSAEQLATKIMHLWRNAAYCDDLIRALQERVGQQAAVGHRLQELISPYLQDLSHA
jgi:3-deoxy-D-manno-octulosonic-acid transferase